ncbi:hypothetical protein PRIPAC_81272, partial [Pristionchus pacificus]|uniref:G protein-coupled receptor n=1 Tax=Pristionchus pacificus TaxID=54126 RepID=A0A2A6CB30_PRIPA
MESNLSQTNAFLITLLLSISSIISALCYVFILIRITRIVSTGSRSLRFRRDLSLIIVGFSLFLTLLFAATFYVFCFIFSRLGDVDRSLNRKDRIGTLQLKTVDSVGCLFTHVALFLSVVNSWMLLFTNRSTRKTILSRNNFDSSSVNIVAIN